MIKRLLVISVFIFLCILPIAAEEAFYQSIINASYLSDFAYGTFPLSLWADFGVSGISLIDGLNTKLYARIEAGMTERSIKQDPVSGEIIDNPEAFGIKTNNLSYSVVFSDGSVVFEQGILEDKKRAGHDYMSMSFAVRMRWEQAFATIKNMRENDFGGIFGINRWGDENKPLFPTDCYLVGTPELSGERYSLSNSFSFSISYDNSFSDYLAPHGYGASMEMVFAPFWFGNKIPSIFEYTYTDAYRFRVNGFYDYSIIQKKAQSGKNLYSVYLTTSANATLLFGDSIPRYLQDKSFMGKNIVPRFFYAQTYAKLQVIGPEFITLGTYPAAYIWIENGLNAGTLMNNNENQLKAEFYGGLGVGLQLTIIGGMRAFIEYQYIYTPIYGQATGGSFNAGCYLMMLF